MQGPSDDRALMLCRTHSPSIVVGADNAWLGPKA
jgi:hypothetical protein